MIFRGVGQDERQVDRHRVGDVWNLDVHDVGAGMPEPLDRLEDARLDVFVDALE